MLSGAQSSRSLFAVTDAVAYLNSASLGPRLHAVNAAGHAAVERMAAPWQIHTADWFEDARRLRALFASLIGARADCVALVPSVSYGIAVAARNVPVASGATTLQNDLVSAIARAGVRDLSAFGDER